MHNYVFLRGLSLDILPCRHRRQLGGRAHVRVRRCIQIILFVFNIYLTLFIFLCILIVFQIFFKNITLSSLLFFFFLIVIQCAFLLTIVLRFQIIHFI